MHRPFSSRFARAYFARQLVALLFLLLLLLNLMLTPARAGEAVSGASEAADGGADAPVEGAEVSSSRGGGETFPIRRFVVYGYTAYPRDTLVKLVDDLRGAGRTSGDVEAARDRIEKFYHDGGYPTTMVNIPEQSVSSGFVYLQVIEGKVGNVAVKGNRWVSEERIRRKLPSMASKEVVNLPRIKEDLKEVASVPDLKVTPAISPGKETGTVDVDLVVEDRIPLHGSVEINNRASQGTSDLRLSASLRYDDLWKKGHSIAAQYQVSPKNTSEVQVASGSYTMPAPWRRTDRMVIYGVWSDSETTFSSSGDSFNTLGQGNIIGARYIFSLPGYGSWGHTALLGVDYKNFRENTTLSGAADPGATSPVEYVPLSVGYNGYLPDASGTTLFNAMVNVAFRGMVTREQQFEDKRYKARANYVYATLGAERRQNLPAGASLLLKLDGQISEQPLISNEQYAAGGMESVRGYKESEASGDSVLHGIVEVSAPNLLPLMGFGETSTLKPYAFYDFATLWVKDALPGQESKLDLHGIGVGIRGLFLKGFEFQVDWGYALSETDKTRKGDSRVHFKAKYQF